MRDKVLGNQWERLSTKKQNNRCHEANQIYALVEADAERQAKEKTEFGFQLKRVQTVLIMPGLDKAAVVNGVR